MRVKLAVPPHGLGTASQRIDTWLKSELSPGRYAWHAAQSIGTAATAIYFKNADDARRFVAQFSDLELADGTRSAASTAPFVKTPDL